MTELYTKELIELATLKGISLGFVESLTGGMASSQITSIPGSSAVFRGALVTYGNELKESLVSVAPTDLAKYTAVSSEVAKQMAVGGRIQLKVDLCVSFTGYAGPSAPAGELGLVYMGMSSRLDSHVRRFQFKGSREEIRTLSVIAGYEWMIETLKKV